MLPFFEEPEAKPSCIEPLGEFLYQFSAYISAITAILLFALYYTIREGDTFLSRVDCVLATTCFYVLSFVTAFETISDPERELNEAGVALQYFMGLVTLTAFWVFIYTEGLAGQEVVDMDTYEEIIIIATLF
ncbi:uncharacterized protein BXIN_2607 [Babesia sp. Xinjiang]|uniref:uncharacterized protein n=1 Tax=Babesia sp. Xinjiang TaxID=462227 RepID=UPI000A2538D7|nr:uncharacterized protein BXIN_2714 [Babesia sp. Xinjiang]XP_028872097.1 uncharacterized protein BXIN_2607 [Babesia sp. Xinjiang]ORM41556.1 hypothetical protein BXIN_2714 [Babesia sp. Xinjiang]ORM41641.1 hypothetical protein BXIN_2607 [Babesia sp. Xinjiang]